MFGHKKGVESLKKACTFALEVGIPYLSAWAFSTANWKRPKSEVNYLMGLLRKTLQSELADFHANGIRLKIIGMDSGLSEDLINIINHAVEVTKNNTKLTLAILFNYDGRAEITCAAKEIARKVRANEIDPESITEDTIANHLMTKDIPDPELLIRTSGVVRLSNYMMWQCAFAEFVFIDKHWPDFDEQDFCYCIQEFQGCSRNFGQISA